VEDAIFSAQQASKHMDVPIGLISDQDPKSDIFDVVLNLEDPEYSSVDKPKNLLKSPFEKTLYLDCDTILLGDISELFDLLDQYELLVTTDPNEAGKILEPDSGDSEVPSPLPIFQTGVLGYRQTSNVDSLIKTWYKVAVKSSYSYEQTAFREAMYKHGVYWMSFSDLYNCLIGWPMQVTGEVKIIHGNINNISPRKIKDITKILNSKSGPRLLYDPPKSQLRAPTRPYLDILLKHSSRIINVLYTPSFHLSRMKSSYQKNGLLETLRKAIDEIK
jgi:hypothetical protein